MESKKIVKRAHKRYRAKEGTFAVLFQDSSKLGHLIDICVDGFSFSFSDSPFLDSDRDGQALLYSGRQHLVEGLTEFDIFLVDSGICLERMPCKIVSKIELEEGDNLASIVTKRCSVQFDELEPEQVSDLNDFIEHWTEEPV
ncbi:MAG: hypothetical protein GY697_19405 [Desulfobacterales bacterium]|nr:hypothetical protein [Desulfobacterales bacterium]